MGAGARSNLGIWAISGVVALAMAAGALMLVELPGRRTPPSARSGGGLGLLPLKSSKLLSEQAELHDPMPLFFSTTRTARSVESAGSGAELDPGQDLARSIPGKLVFSEETAAVESPLPTSVLGRPADALALGAPELPFLGMGRVDKAVTPLPERAAYLKVTAAGSGQTVLSSSITGVRVPAATDWQPLELLVVVDRVGLVAPPTVSRTSTVDSVDNFFRDYLQKAFHLGERLGPGSYVVTIGR